MRSNTAAGQQTHGTTFRALKVTSQVATPGAESAVYDGLVVYVSCVRGLVLLRRRCDTSPTSGSVDDVMFAHNDREYEAQKKPYIQSDSTDGSRISHRGVRSN